MADAAAGDRGASGKHWIVEWAIDRGGERRPSRAADIAEESLKDTEVRIARGTERDPFVVERHRAADGQLRVVTDQLQILYPDHVLVEGKADRTGIADRIIKERHLQRVDGSIDEEMIEICQLTGDPDRTAGHRRR